MDTPFERKLIIAVCGGLNWDMITVTHRVPQGGETLNSKTFSMMPGGKGANSAIALHRLSHIKPTDTNDGGAPRNVYEDCGLPDIKVHMVGSVGDDDFGRKMKTSLAEHFINVDCVVEQKRMTSAVAVTLVESQTGENRILVHPGANHVPTAADFKTLNSFGLERPSLVVAQLELNRETVAQLIETAKEAGIDTLLNPSPAHFLDRKVYRGLTHLILNESEAAIQSRRDIEEVTGDFSDWGTITDEFHEKGVQYVVITLGKRGAFLSEQKGKGGFVDAVKVDEKDLVDTSGAGYALSQSSSIVPLLFPRFSCSLPLPLSKPFLIVQWNGLDLVWAANGCGRDTFVGAYSIQWVKHTFERSQHPWDIRAAVEYACRASAFTIQQVGCQESIPWASEIVSTDNQGSE